MNRQQFIDSIHDIIKVQGLTLPDVILGLSQILTDLGLTLWLQRPNTQGLKQGLNPELLKVVEQAHYECPSIDSALILQSALMVVWVEDWIKMVNKGENNNERDRVSST